MRIGLRFNQKDKNTLARLAIEFEGQPGIDTRLYRYASEAARTGEPLIVQCEMAAEAHQMAQMFSNLGVTPPTVEALSGTGPNERG